MPFRVTSCGLAGIEICLAKANVAPSHLAGYDTRILLKQIPELMTYCDRKSLPFLIGFDANTQA